MDVREYFHRCLHLADAVVAKIDAQSLGKSTPCAEWDIQALVKHMAYELAWVPDLFNGKTVAQVGDKFEGDLLGQDLQKSWHEYCGKALEVVQYAELDTTVHLSYADVTAEHYILECGSDILVHGWDVARALGEQYKVDEPMARIAYEFMKPREIDLRATGMFGEAVDVKKDAPVWYQLLGLYGRSLA